MSDIDTTATVQKHAAWVAEKVAEAKEIGLRDGLDSLKISHVVALLSRRVEELEAQLSEIAEQIETEKCGKWCGKHFGKPQEEMGWCLKHTLQAIINRENTDG